MEHVAAAQLATSSGASFHCLDAPLPLQEHWVASLLSHFRQQRQLSGTAASGQLPFELTRDAAALEARLPASFPEWDRRLAAEFAGAGAGAAAMMAFKLARAAAAAALRPRELPAVTARLRRLQVGGGLK